MGWWIFLLVLFLGFLAFVGVIQWRERQFLKKNLKEVMPPVLRQEVDQERQDAVRRKQKFESQLKKFEN